MIKKPFYSIAESLSYMESLKIKTERMPDLLGFKSTDIAANYKVLIQLANSLAIIFLQYDLHDVALISLKYASDADLKLHRYGNTQDKLWEGSMITYNNLILLFHKVNHFKESLKLIYQAQSFMISIKKSNLKLSPEIEICTHILSFISLWRVGRASESISYIQSATDILNDFIEGRIFTKLSQAGLDNLFGIIASSLAAVKITVEKNKQEALAIIAKALNEVDGNAGCRGILENLLNFISENSQFNLPVDGHDDWLCGKMFNKIMIITSFIPLIDPKTPLIRSEELENAKTENSIRPLKQDFSKNSKFILKRQEKIQNSRNNINNKQNTLTLKKEKIFNKPRNSYFNESPPRKVKHWWESKEYLNNFDSRKTNNNTSFISEPKRIKRTALINHSLILPKNIMQTPLKISTRNQSMLDSLQKYNNEEANSSFPGFSLDFYQRYQDNICD